MDGCAESRQCSGGRYRAGLICCWMVLVVDLFQERWTAASLYVRLLRTSGAKPMDGGAGGESVRPCGNWLRKRPFRGPGSLLKL